MAPPIDTVSSDITIVAFPDECTQDRRPRTRRGTHRSAHNRRRL